MTEDTGVTARTLTLEERVALTSGLDMWHTKPLEGRGVPSVLLSDGPHGLRKQEGSSDHLGIAASLPATCFPPAAALASSWDVELVERVGSALGVEAVNEGVGVVLGPGINIKRSPLCGRNFEYFSEDPILSGVLGAASVRGIQSSGAGASLKHFAANNQESDRFRSSSDVDPRPLREIYLRGFQRVVQDAKPWTVMCSYNRLNGVHASEDPWLLTSVLRTEWGFDGLVVSDWGAVNDRIAALTAGLDLEMPSSGAASDARIVEAVRAGVLPEHVVDAAADRVLGLIDRVEAGAADTSVPTDIDAHHALAKEAAVRSIVLLRNEGALLPIPKSASIAVIGEFAATPRYQGAGSSLVHPTRLDTALDGIRLLSEGEVSFEPGFGIGQDSDPDDDAWRRADAVAAAARADVTVLFLGLPAHLESEGYDRVDIDLPPNQLDLVRAVLEVTLNVVVVLSNGGAVALPFSDEVPAILEGWLLGQAGGGATAEILFGERSPSAKLAETIPRRLQDSPAFLDFPGEHSHTRYGEGIFVGYRWYDAREIEVAFPFGHGLSYAQVEYGDARAWATEAGDIEVRVTLRNAGSRDGREIVQVYTSLTGSSVRRPVRELKAFASIAVPADGSRDVALTIRREDLAYWDRRFDRWVVEGGTYDIAVAASSRDIRSTVRVSLEGDDALLPLTRESSLAEALDHPAVGVFVRAAMDEFFGGADGVSPVEAMMGSIPVGRLPMVTSGQIQIETVDALISASAMSGPGARA